MEYKILTVEYLEDVNIFNSIDEDIDILIIERMYFNYNINDFFKNVKFPVTLKKIFIKNCKTNVESTNMIKLNLLIIMCDNVILPFDCTLHIRFLFSSSVVYYSSSDLDKIKTFKVDDNNELIVTNSDFLSKIRIYED
jgi:hypothetical protein